MRAALMVVVGLCASATLFPSVAPAHGHRRLILRAPGPTRLGPWVEEGWRREDWSRAPAVRAPGFSAPRDFDPVTGYPSSEAEYPWGYTTPFERVGRLCVASDVNVSPGGMVARYQRVMPSYYCR